LEDDLKKKHKKIPQEQLHPGNRVELWLERRSKWIPLGGLFLAAGLFFYYWLIVHPEYIQFAQQPVFFAERRFWLEGMRVPGGFLDILASYLTELFQYGWLGAVILTALTLIAFLLVRAALRAGSWWIAPLVPVLLLIALQSGYDYPLSKSLSFILALEGFILYRDGFPRKAGSRFGITILFLAVVYVLSPGAMLLLVLLCVLLESLKSGQPAIVRLLLPLGYLAAAILLPFAAGAKIFLAPLPDAYLRHAFLWYADDPHPLLETKTLLEGFLGLAILIFSGIFIVRGKEEREGRSPGYKIVLFQAFIAIVLLTAGVWTAAAWNQKEVLFIRYASHTGKWNRVTEHIDSRTVQNPLCLFHFNRATFHLGRMSSGLFSIPQNFGRHGLFLHTDLSFRYPLDRSDFSFEMGHVNEAKRWALEALSHYGESSDVLKRLALIGILQNDYPLAARFLNRLRQNPTGRSWADHYLSCLAEPAKLRDESFLQKIHAGMPRHDFVINSDHPEIDLEKILSQAPGNRMAFEYLMMNCLITRDLDGFARNLIRFRHFTKDDLPRHYEEALIAYLVLKKTTDSAVSQIELRKSTVDRFKDFERILSNYNGDSKAAYSELSRSYADTYWFHILFARQVL
jgi:hypothetical protein